MEQKRDLAIVLRAVPYEERHRIVTALTENNGKVSAMARNAVQSRRFGGALDTFAASEWRFVEKPGAELVRLEEAQIRRVFDGIRKDFRRLSLASVFSELMLRLAPEREPCPDLFKLHSNALAVLEEASGEVPYLALLNGYLAKLLQWNGHQPQLQRCMGCQRSLQELDPDVPLACVVADAGWLCDKCRPRHLQSFRVSPSAMADFFMSLTRPIRQLPGVLIGEEDQQRQLFAFLEALLVYHVQGFDRTPLKGLRFLGLESNL
jgi:DNA repair protein RecO